MNWGTELWDQYENLSVHTQKGIDFLERYGHFVRDRATIECEYAYKLRRLVKSYLPKKKDEDEVQFSTCKAFKMLINEVNDLAGQHEVVAENLQAQVLKELTMLVKDLRDERKKQLLEGAKLQQMLHTQIESLFRSKKAYDKAYKEAEKAVEHFQKADADFNLSRAEVEKQRTNMSYKSQVCESAKKEYADQLQRTNELQRQHYRSGLPDVFRQLQDHDEKRIRNIRHFILHSVDIERDVFPIIHKCLDGIVRAADVINEKEDTILVIERYKSGFTPPEDIPFQDLSRGDGSGGGGGGSDSGSGSTPTAMMNHSNNTLGLGSSLMLSGGKGTKEGSTGLIGGLTVKGTVSGKGLKKRTGLFNIFSGRGNAAVLDGKEDYSDLAPNQRRKKLKQKVEELQTKVTQETAARDGLMKMKGVYEANPALGDPMTIEGQLNESSHKLDKLQAELKRFTILLDEATATATAIAAGSSPHQLVNGGNNTRNNSISNNSPTQDVLRRRSMHGGGGDSLSRSESDSSMNNTAVVVGSRGVVAGGKGARVMASKPGTPHLNHGPESGLGTSHTSLTQPGGADSDHDQYDGGGGSGRATAGNNGDSHGGDPDFYDNIYDNDALPALGTCKALYPFEATSEGSIPMDEHEELHIIESDQGDGWTRVRRINGEGEEGFVPTSYVELNLYNHT